MKALKVIQPDAGHFLDVAQTVGHSALIAVSRGRIAHQSLPNAGMVDVAPLALKITLVSILFRQLLSLSSNLFWYVQLTLASPQVLCAPVVNVAPLETRAALPTLVGRRHVRSQ